MTTQRKLIQKKPSLLDLGEYLQNVSEACRIYTPRRVPVSTSTISSKQSKKRFGLVSATSWIFMPLYLFSRQPDQTVTIEKPDSFSSIYQISCLAA